MPDSTVTISSATIATNGTTFTIVFSGNVSSSSDDPTKAKGMLYFSPSRGTFPLTYTSGNGTDTWVCELSDSVIAYSDDNSPSLYYLPSTGGETNGGNLADDSSEPLGEQSVPITNNSTQTEPTETVKPTVEQISINADGRGFTFLFSEGMSPTTSNLEDTVSISGMSLGDVRIESASFVSGASSGYSFSINKFIFSDELSGISFSYAPSGSTEIADVSGNTLAPFSARALDVNNSGVIGTGGATGSLKQLFFWTDLDEFEPVNFYQFRSTYPNTTIKRVGFLTDFDWVPANHPRSGPYNNETYGTDVVSVPESFVQNYLQRDSNNDGTLDRPWWADVDGTTPTDISLGYLRAAMRGDVPYLRYAPEMFDIFWLDPEPGSAWWSYSDGRFSDADKNEFWSAMKTLNDVYIEELGGSTANPLTWYASYPTFTGRQDDNEVVYGGAQTVLSWAYQNIDGSVLDDTPLFGERNFYISDRLWSVAFDNARSNYNENYTRFGQYMQIPSIVAYPNPISLPVDSIYNKPPYTTTETITGGIDLWKSEVRSALDLMTENGYFQDNRKVAVILRSKFSGMASLQNFDPIYSSFEPPIPLDYWREMIRYLCEQPEVKIIGMFARGISQSTNVGDSSEPNTPLDLYTAMAEIVDEYNQQRVDTIEILERDGVEFVDDSQPRLRIRYRIPDTTDNGSGGGIA